MTALTRYTREEMEAMDPVIDRLIDDTESHLAELEQGEREGFHTHNQQLYTNTRIYQLKALKGMLRQAAQTEKEHARLLEAWKETCE